MTIQEYIINLQFDSVKFFQKKRHLKSLRIYKEGENHYYEELSNIASNALNLDEFEIKIEDGNPESLKAFFQKESNAYNFSTNHYETTSIIQFIGSGDIQGQLNCNFLRSQFLNQEGEGLNYCSEDISNLYAWAKAHEHQIMPYRPANINYNKWKQFLFPQSFYWSTNFDVFETSIDINLNSVNSKQWRLAIPRVDHRPTIEQIETIQKFYSKRWELRKLILDKLYTFYQTTARHDFQLPKLDNQDQLLYFLRSGSISLTEEDFVTISFGTWDEEHGAYYHYFINENRLEEM